MNKDYYSILGVNKDATPDQLKSAFRKLAIKYHPDKQAGKSDAEKKEAEEKFKEINEAYDTLSDPQKRQQYDNPSPFGGQGISGFRDANGDMHFTWTSDGGGTGNVPPGFDPFDMFARMMGGRGGFRRQDPNAPRPGDDILLVLNIDFMESIEGCTKTVKLNIEDNCGCLNGCDKCHHTGRVLKTITVEVKVPKGILEGKRLRVAEQGNRGINGGPNGDIYFQIHIGEHETFVRDGYDLLEKVDVPFETFVLGGILKIPTLDGIKEHKLPANSKPGRTLLFRGYGSPIMNSLNGKGDLRVFLNLVMPENITDVERGLLEKYRDERNKH